MSVERREQVTYVGMESTGNRRNFLSWRKPAGFHGWHEPDESRDSRPDLWEARGAIPRAYPAPQLEGNARSNEDGGIGVEPNNPKQCSEVADGVARQSEGIAQLSLPRTWKSASPALPERRARTIRQLPSSSSLLDPLSFKASMRRPVTTRSVGDNRDYAQIPSISVLTNNMR